MAADDLEGFPGMKYFDLLKEDGAQLLTYILKLGTNAPTTPPGRKFDEYLKNPPAGVNINYFSLSSQGKKNAFDSSQMEQMKSDLMWDNFDVTFLYKAIRLGNKNVAPLDNDKWRDKSEMEGLVKSIKDLRNEHIHSKFAVTYSNFDVKFNELKDIFVQTLHAAQKRYGVPERDLITVKTQILQNMDAKIQAFTSMEAVNFIKIKTPVFIPECQYHLKNEYQHDITFDPLSFLKLSPQRRIHVESIYCEAYLQDDKEEKGTCRTINCLDLLSLTCSAELSSHSTTSSHSTRGTQPQLIMIEGQAGSGKTTLILFMLSEWLKDAHHCRIEHLNEFDILLRIVCREHNEPSLQQFLANTLPNEYSEFPQSLVTLLKHCSKVIFLIDGLDELSSGSQSEQLVNDILTVGKGMPNLNIICTSRPEAANAFMAKIPARYRKWELMMKGVSPEHRADFVLKHYSVLPGDSKTNPDTVRHYMDNHGWKDHFGLPLNLLFVATLFYTDPNSIGESSTQSGLYIKIHAWCVQKLLERLAKPCYARESTLACDIGVREVLHDLHCVALQGLLEDRLSLSDEDVLWLTECCNKKNLPVDEVLGAFFCLREKVVKHVPYRWYSAPHKSLQEFFAANYIVNKLDELFGLGSEFTTHPTHNKKRKTHHIDDSIQKPVSESIMQTLGYPSLEQLKNLRNLLLHVLGILGQRGDPSLSGAVQDVVDLVAKSGIADCNAWLTLLDDAEINEAALQRIVHHIKDDEREQIKITDSNIDSIESLLPLIPRKTVRIILEKPVDISKLTKACEKHNCMSLELYHHYKHPQQHSTSDCVLAARNWNELQIFVGHLSGAGILALQGCTQLSFLRLSFCGGRDINDIPSALTSVQPLLPELRHLHIHVPVMTLSTPWGITTSLPDVMYNDGCPGVTLVLSGVNDALMDTACRAAQTLQPKNGYSSITFPGSNMSADSLGRLLNGLAGSGVRVGKMGVRVPDSSPVTKLEVKQLDEMAKREALGRFRRLEEYVVWR